MGFQDLGIRSREADAFSAIPSVDVSEKILSHWMQVTRWVSPITLANEYEIFDFTRGYDAKRELRFLFGIGRYNEDRRGMYTSSIFLGVRPDDARTIHVGLDLGAPEGTSIFAPVEGEIWGAGYLDGEGDYGGTIIVKCAVPPSFRNSSAGNTSDDFPNFLFMLFGHLSKSSADRWKAGARIERGELLGWLGNKIENGGWNPHLHWQLSWCEPEKVDLPGAVSKKQLSRALEVFPDPMPLLADAIGGWKLSAKRD